VLKKFFRTGMKNNHFANRGGPNFAVPLHDRLQMQIANGAARESPELQMHHPFPIGHPNALGMDRQKLTPLHDGTGSYMRHRPHPALCDFVEHLVR
jgi:hypothetical protein